MSRNARTPDPLALMRASDPVDAVALRAELGAAEIEATIARAIGRAERPPDVAPPGEALAAAPVSNRRRTSRPLVLAGALIALIAAVLLLTGSFSGAGSHPTYAAAAVKVAKSNPRLLVTAPGWQVTDANEFEIGNGEMTFTDGSRKLSLTWYPARLYRSYLRDRASVGDTRRSRLLGHVATTVDYGRGEYATMLSPFGAVFVELRGRLGGNSAYRSVLASLRQVGVEAWLGEMPPSVVSPEAQPRTVARMLRGVPLPPGFDPAALGEESTVLDHYALGVKVADAVACGWVEAWLAARRSGDSAAAGEAVAAMTGSRGWPLLRQMERRVSGGWAHNIWNTATELQNGRLDQGPAGESVNPDGSGYSLGPAWAVELQCAARITRTPFSAGEAPGGAP